MAELEDDILCFLPTVSDLDVFGCELDLLDLHTQQLLPEAFTVLLQRPKLQIVARPCMVDASGSSKLTIGKAAQGKLLCQFASVAVGSHMQFRATQWAKVEWSFFFHEYGRRVGMVPRSSLKEGKNRQMVQKGTKAPKPTQTKHPSPQAETPPSCSLPSTLGETCEN